MLRLLTTLSLLWLALRLQAYHFDPQFEEWNLNENRFALTVTEYWGEWTGHDYTASPENWRFPFYSIMPDRFVNGDPINDDINGTYFEHDPRSNQLRHGGDVVGIRDSLDYIQGMGIKGLYLIGSPFMNLPSGYDQYSPVDLSLLDQHLGTIQQFRELIDDIHSRGMYVILDNTFATLSDLIGFDGFPNTTAPFTVKEHQVKWKTSRQYLDFDFGNSYNATCDYPRFWNETGFPVEPYVTASLKGCYNSEFDQYGDTEAFGVFPDWRRELSKFGSVQDRLREWHPPVRAKLENFYCMLIAQLDIDGFRYDKATQSTVDAIGYMNNAMRQCARRYGKTNFFVPGEITGGNDFGAIFLGRGRQPDMVPQNLTQAALLTNESSDQYFIRSTKNSALDSAAFHYTVYRTLLRFLGMDGNLEAGYDAPENWVDMWNTFLVTNDFVNAETGIIDPRHMYGVSNQDVFRWPAIQDGTQRQLLGHFVTTLLMPGIPLVLWGEEQAFYVLDNTADNYIFGRSPMSTTTAWQDHGCYSLDAAQFYQWPVTAARNGCHDDTVSYDHRDPSAPVRNVLKHMYHLRETFPVLNDGFFLQQLSNATENVYYPGSSGVATETGFWSILRSAFPGVQNFTSNNNFDNSTQGRESTLYRRNTTNSAPLVEQEYIWLMMSNVNRSRTFQFDCSDDDSSLNTRALVAPFKAGTTVRNLLPPYDEITLGNSSVYLGLAGSSDPNGCLDSLHLPAYGYRAYVPSNIWRSPRPTITKFTPGHDARIISDPGPNGKDTIDISLEFSLAMDCQGVTNSIMFNSSIYQSQLPNIKSGSVACADVANSTVPDWPGSIPSTWVWSATLENVSNGILTVSVRNASDETGKYRTNANDRFMLRIGNVDNPMVFPRTGNYSKTLVERDEYDNVYIRHAADGADLWRYSTNWDSSKSPWMPYPGGLTPIQILPWNGTSLQEWRGHHVRLEYWSQLSGSSSHIQEGDVDFSFGPRRFPHLFLEGPFNNYGYDEGFSNQFSLQENGMWDYYFLTEWPAIAQVNVWGINPDGNPDHTYVMGDVDGDSVLDRALPSALSATILNITEPPPRPYIGWLLQVDDGTSRYNVLPQGNMRNQMIIFILLWVLPAVGASVSVWLYKKSFYGIKFEEYGLVLETKTWSRLFGSRKGVEIIHVASENIEEEPDKNAEGSTFFTQTLKGSKFIEQGKSRRTVLIATMEYDIEDWQIKVKIGGLGVMAQLMGKNLGHQNLVWVVPCVADCDYPMDESAAAMNVRVLGKTYRVDVQYHRLRNITYVLLDAPVFRQQSKAEPYPARMDDLGSAVYYSAWNQCIAQTIERFQPDIYHINDYHGCIAPLYLLPSTIPVCLSLHNAEFQGLWPMRTYQECEEVGSLFNLPTTILQQFVQFGEVFNLLHAGASYLRAFQRGFGAVGVSKKYGTRSYLRYPIFWGLKKIGHLPNPDPSDTGEWDKILPREEDITIDKDLEASRPELKRQAQEWAGLNIDPDAELFVFVGRWSNQKGIDLIADAFPYVLENYKHAQLVCVGPIIDLYGKFAAAKLDRMMKLYPGRVFSKPVFTALPPFIFSGAEFALIPSRDEPFGLVAVEFGKKGALGVGARVGGLGQMPGWWYTIESMQTAHLLDQFKTAIEQALSSKQSTRAMMRARSAKQRFPVAQWKEDLETLQSTAIQVHRKKTYEMLEKDDKKIVRVPRRLQRRIRREQRGKSTIEEAELRRPKTDPYPSENESEASESDAGWEPSLTLRQIEPDDENGTYDAWYESTFDGDWANSSASESGTEDEDQEFHLAYAVNPYRTPRMSTQIFNNTRPLENPESQFPAPPKEVEAMKHESVNNETPEIREVLQSRGAGTPKSVEDRITELPNFSSDQSSRDVTSGTSSSPYSTPLLGSMVGTRPGSLLSNSSTHSIAIEASANGYSGSLLSGGSVVGKRKNYKLQQVDPTFTDSSGEFYKDFSKKLQNLKSSNSESKLCIEEYLQKSEKKFFGDLRNARLGVRPRPTSRLSSRFPSGTTLATLEEVKTANNVPETSRDAEKEGASKEMDNTAYDYVPVSPLRKYMQIRVGDWPIYAFLLAFGQVIAANSYQIILLTGQVGQAAEQVYVICSLYIVATLLWWILFRRLGSRVVLSLPFLFYGLAFLFVGLARFAPPGSGRSWINHLSSGAYGIASASGVFFFVLNFGDEGGSRIRAWIYRACVIQGTQQIYITVLWFWGYHVNITSTAGQASPLRAFANTGSMTAIGIAIAVFFWISGGLIFAGLPVYYRQIPGIVPDFYKSILKRKIVVWFFVTVLIQNFFLSPQYGRSWSFLFNSTHISPGEIYALVAFFFVLVWICVMWGFSLLTHSHTWILPIFAIGIGAPRWAQIWWGTSNMATWLPWAPGSYIGSALLARALWLWLGLLDAIQGVGMGMILLSTLTRMHVLYTLAVAQVLGAGMTAIARACAPNNVGPGPVFPDLTNGIEGLKNAWFWIGLLLNLSICIGYFKFFRKEQLTKP